MTGAPGANAMAKPALETSAPKDETDLAASADNDAGSLALPAMGSEEAANAAGAERREPMPLPRNLQTFLLFGIFTILLFYTLYFTGEFVLPIIFAMILYLVLQPAMRAFMRLHIPKAVSAVLVICILFGALGALGFMLSAPAANWIAKGPSSLAQLESQLFFIKGPIAQLQDATKQVEKIAEGTTPNDGLNVTVSGPGLGSFLISGTRSVLVGMGTTIILLFFLLMSGDLFLRRFVEILPTLANKKQAVEITREIERNISGYLATISMMNLLVGIATGLATYLLGMSDPVLWGTMAFLLNFIPILGPLCGIAILFMAGLLTFGTIWHSLLLAGVYLVIHVLEGETLTPLLLARRFVLNPVLVIVSLVFWYWMWGVPGALLAVPLLATVKIICDRIQPLMAIGHFLGAEGRA
jgi:predicted PurR-regulated permease PerM